jgi:uncharacterized protein (TIGR04255 family)
LAGRPQSSSIVDFKRPPVVEVALAIQHGAPTADVLDIAALSTRLKGEFPAREEHPSRPPIQEQFGPVPPGPPFQIQFLSQPPMSRFWLLSANGSRLLQVQHDLVALNWRKVDDQRVYPRYGSLKQPLRRYIREYTEVLREAGKSDLEPNWCEVLYVNHVMPLEGQKQRPPLSDVLAGIKPLRTKFLPDPEDAQFATRYVIEKNSQPLGRLTAMVSPAVRNEDQVPLWIFTLTSRVLASEPSVKSALAALDIGREWVVRAFKEMTTAKMHEVWQLQEPS